ncbi:MAG: ferritin-like domain-containing protein [Rhodospirillaceae bacterium]|nr:ferritin-like domain-containing protein [Rhodospirillaceae bacterium]
MGLGYRHWTMEDFPWDKFDLSKVDEDQVRIVRAAALVEYNADDYVKYLSNVFHDDPEFVQAAHCWGEEEKMHGLALSRWAGMVPPGYDFPKSFDNFREKIKLDLQTHQSVRGSRPGELVARCMVEVGTSSYYSALADATEEPVLKEICRKIASDELRHYKLFYDHLRRYLKAENVGKFKRLKIAAGRIMETENDELAYAYYAANHADMPYDREKYNHEYMRRAYAYYRPTHINRGMAMIFKAVGLQPHSTLFKAVAGGARWYMTKRQRALARAADREARQHGAATAAA